MSVCILFFYETMLTDLQRSLNTFTHIVGVCTTADLWKIMGKSPNSGIVKQSRSDHMQRTWGAEFVQKSHGALRVSWHRHEIWNRMTWWCSVVKHSVFVDWLEKLPHSNEVCGLNSVWDLSGFRLHVWISPAYMSG